MPPPPGDRLRAYIDADVLLAGATTDRNRSASLVVLAASDITLIDLVASQVVLDECTRNLERLVANASQLQALEDTLNDLVERSIDIVDPPRLKVETEFKALADDKDATHLAAAVEHRCPFLVTYNVRDYQPGHEDVTVVEPGTLVRRMRERLRGLA